MKRLPSVLLAVCLTQAALCSAESVQAGDKQPQVFDVRKYGAQGDGTTVDTQSIQAAIDAFLFYCCETVRVGVFARILPVWGVYGRNVRTLRLEDLRLTSKNADETRPVVLAGEVGNLVLDEVQCPDMPAKATSVQRNNP